VTYLLDTNVLLRLFAGPARIKRSVLNELSKPANDVYVSAASTWEIAIKVAIGKLALPEEPEKYVLARMREFGLRELPILTKHTFEVGRLPLHHADPFDRMLISQARVEEMVIVTSDRIFARYPVRSTRA
jgi:PIN domain nuclease of toxin-antitoxin system